MRILEQEGDIFCIKKTIRRKDRLSVFPSVVDQSTQIFQQAALVTVSTADSHQGLCWDGRFWMENSNLSLSHNGWEKTMFYTVFYTEKSKTCKFKCGSKKVLAF